MTEVCIHGLGHVGLPTAVVLADAGHDVVGYDVDPDRREQLEDGEFATDDPTVSELYTSLFGSGLSIASSPEPADCHIICTPTPLGTDHRVDLSAVETAGDSIAGTIREGDLVVLESTVPPGVTTGRLRHVLETSGLTAGSEFSLAYSPETVLPENAVAELRTNDRIVGGVDDESTARVRSLYESITAGDIHVAPDPTTAEFVKLAQNTFRDVNVALANELAVVARDYGVDSRKGIALANTHPRVSVHDPGLGVGGHCIPVDPHFLEHDSDSSDLIPSARRVNDRMPAYVAGLVADRLDSRGSVAILGVAYKGNASDVRHSPALQLANRLTTTVSAHPRLRADGADVGANTDGRVVDLRFHDPHVDEPPVECTSLEEALDGVDVVVVGAAHDEYRTLAPETVASLAGDPLVIDAEDALDTVRWRESNLEYLRI